MIPDCPVCKTNKYMIEDYDVAAHASGIDNTGKYCISYSDSFECSCCGGRIHYYEERVADKLCAVEINYKQKNYNMRRKVVG